MAEIYNIPLTAQTIKSMEPEKLTEMLVRRFIAPIPTSIESVEDLKEVGVLMGKLMNDYSYIQSTLCFLKIWAREAKANENHDESVKMMMRRDTVETIAEVLKNQYTCLSRQITIKAEVNREINMTDSVTTRRA